MSGALQVLRVVLALACVVGLIWLVARRYGAASGRRAPVGPTVRVVGRQALGRHAGVAIVAVGNRQLLLGYGEQQVTMLTELAPASATPQPQAPALGSRLARPARPAGAGSSGGTAGPTSPVQPGPLGLVPTAETAPGDDPLSQDATLPPAVVQPGALDGSILSPATWRRAVAALQERTVRR